MFPNPRLTVDHLFFLFVLLFYFIYLFIYLFFFGVGVGVVLAFIILHVKRGKKNKQNWQKIQKLKFDNSFFFFNNFGRDLPKKYT